MPLFRMRRLDHERAELLILVGNTGWQGSHVPVDMRVSSRATETQHIDPLGGNSPLQREGNLQDEALKAEVFVLGEVRSYCFAMPDRGDEGIAVQRVKVREEHDVLIIAVDDGPRSALRSAGRSAASSHR